MNGIKKIVLGLSVSVDSILFAQQFATANTNIETSNNQKDDVKISLYKEAKADTLEATEISLDENIDIDNYKVSSEQNNIPITINDVKTISSKEEDTSPWVVAQSAKPQNKQEINNSKAKSKELPEELAKYRVAERIKQSIIFPIPEEILNDENLTPTFITPAPPVIEKKETRAKKILV